MLMLKGYYVAPMKKIVIAILGALTILASSSGTAIAMSNSGPIGTEKSGIYKDSFSVDITHGNQGCGGSGSYFKYTYVSTDDGTHQYAFYADQEDNPYVMVDGSNTYQSLDMTCSLAGAGNGTPKYTLIGQFSATLDTKSPGASITVPSGTVSTTASTYNVSGIAGDPENNLTSVKPIVNGVVGPAVTMSGYSFSVNVSLKAGANTVQMFAYDIVGHTGTSNTVTINKTSGSGGSSTTGGGTTTSGGSSGTSSSGQNSTSPSPTSSASATNSTSHPSTSKSSQSAATVVSTPPIVNFGQEQLLNLTDPYGNDASSQAVNVLDTLSIAGATGTAYDLLIAGLVILLALCAFVIVRFKPIFTELDKDKSGLRKRIVIIVTLPSLLPLLGLGFLGYQQLSQTVTNTLSSQLEKAAQTSSLKLGRELSIRELVISKTASDILQINSQFQSQQQQLVQQRTSCQQVVQADIPKKQYSGVTGNSSCLPFLTGFAQLVSSSAATVSDYQDALNQGATQAGKTLTDQNNQRINELLGSVRDYFPDVLELDIIGVGDPSTPEAILPRTDSSQSTTSQVHKDLFSLALKGNLAQLDSSGKDEQLYVTYPIVLDGKTLGGAVAALDMQNQDFVPSIWRSTPEPYSADKTYFITDSGQLVMPTSSGNLRPAQVVSLAKNSPGSVYSLKLGSQTLATRTSPVSDTNWVVAVGAPANSVLAPLAGIQRTALLAIAGFILLSFLLGLWFVSGIAGEIETLLQGARIFAKGNLDSEIKLNHRDELKVLGDTMNQMARDIKSAQLALIEKDKDFINIATHELRTPLTIAEANLSTALLPGFANIPPKVKTLVEQAYKDTKHLRDIVNDMLDVARLEAGHVQFKLEPLDITGIAKTVVDITSASAMQAGVTLVYAPTILPKVLADQNKLQIVLTNFVGNAIKYNKAGGTVTISHKIEGNSLTTSIADTGLGIPEDQQTHIFEKFFRVQHADRATVPGTGLGMYITKQFVEAMGGKVWFTSVHGHGTTFNFSLALESANNVPVTSSPVQITSSSAILKPELAETSDVQDTMTTPDDNSNGKVSN